MEISKDELIRQSKTLTISQMAKIHYVSYGTMYYILKSLGYQPKKRGRKAVLTIK